MALVNTLLVLSYDGTPFYGWQRQPKLPTVQGELERALSKVLNESISLKGAGRTDRGVHALRQYANFLSSKDFSPSSLKKSLNAILSPEIRVLQVIKNIPQEFDARRNAVWREYRYITYRGEFLPPFLNRYCYLLKKDLDIEAVRRAASLFVGTHDFSAFCDGEPPDKSKIREILEFRIEDKPPFLIFVVKANAFLRHMVRITVSTMIDIGTGKKSEDDLKMALNLGDRSLSSSALSPKGLWLWDVKFVWKAQRKTTEKVL
ncbi:MAG: tRNA pseudouridine(38-40) synthase TruA [Synergistetes bacterium]|nr:tRNA pseudouridine(38-40) synthase TruA [Synergistota bacterium]